MLGTDKYADYFKSNVHVEIRIHCIYVRTTGKTNQAVARRLDRRRLFKRDIEARVDVEKKKRSKILAKRYTVK